jgi:FixJ family two-component response regulator
MDELSFQVHLIDDDERIRVSLSRLLSVAGYPVRTYQDAESYLQADVSDEPGCIVVDLGLPGKNGFELQEALKTDRNQRPLLFLTGQGDIPKSVKAMKAGAVDFLAKPVDADRLLAAVEEARTAYRATHAERIERQAFEDRVARLTPREQQVLDHVVAGRLNKQIAADLGTVEKTVKVHRGRMMAKMGVRTIADLVRIVQQYRR